MDKIRAVPNCSDHDSKQSSEGDEHRERPVACETEVGSKNQLRALYRVGEATEKTGRRAKFMTHSER
jgi:hypothetical protein